MPNWYMLFKSRDTDKKKLEFIKTILEYAFEDKVPNFAYADPSTFTSVDEYVAFDAFWSAKPLIDNQKRENAAGENGKKGGRPPKNQGDKPGGLQDSEENQNPGGEPGAFIKDKNIKENNKIENKNQKCNIENSKTSFVPPTVDEVKIYCQEHNYIMDAEQFVDFYSSKGWFVGRNHMKDWRAAVRNWMRTEREGRFSCSPQGSHNMKNQQTIGVVHHDPNYKIRL